MKNTMNNDTTPHHVLQHSAVNARPTALKHRGNILAIAAVLLSSHVAAASLTEIDTAARLLDAAALQQHSNSSQDDYPFAYAQYRLAVTASVTGKDETLVKNALTAAAQRLELLSKSGDARMQTEALALLASVRGMQAGLSPLKGAYYGKLSADAVKAAAALDAHNPRLLLVRAILAYQTPALFGGSTQDAMQYADAAVVAFSKPCSGICWGGEEAYVWRGLAKKANGDIEGANADWQRALQQAPDYGWARQLLAKKS